MVLLCATFDEVDAIFFIHKHYSLCLVSLFDRGVKLILEAVCVFPIRVVKFIIHSYLSAYVAVGVGDVMSFRGSVKELSSSVFLLSTRGDLIETVWNFVLVIHNRFLY